MIKWILTCLIISVLSLTTWAAPTAMQVESSISGYLDNSGKVLARGTIAFYTSDTFASYKTVYSDSAKTTVISQPITLNSSGIPVDSLGTPITIFADGVYWMRLKAVTGLVIRTCKGLSYSSAVNFGGLYVDVASTYGRTDAALTAALAAYSGSSSQVTLLFNGGEFINSSARTVSSNITFSFTNGAVLTNSAPIIANNVWEFQGTSHVNNSSTIDFGNTYGAFESALQGTGAYSGELQSEYATNEAAIPDRYSTLQLAITAINSAPSVSWTILVTATCNSTATASIPTNVQRITVKTGGFLAITGTLTLNGQFLETDKSNIFRSGAVTGNIANNEIYPGWFGAIGDDAVDDYTALFYSEILARGKRLEMESKTYLVGHPIQFQGNNTQIELNGAKIEAIAGYSTIAGYSQTNMFQLLGDNIAIKNGELSNKINGLGVLYIQGDNALVSAIKFTDSVSSYITVCPPLLGGDFAVIEKCQFNDTTLTGIWVKPDPTYTTMRNMFTVRDCYFYRSPTYIIANSKALSVESCEKVSVSDIQIEGGYATTYFGDIKQLNIDKMKIERSYSVTGVYSRFLDLVTCDYVAITNSEFNSSLGATTSGIHFDSGVKDIWVDNCKFDNIRRGIYAEVIVPTGSGKVSTKNIQISNSEFYRCGWGILARGMDYLHVHGNTFINNQLPISTSPNVPQEVGTQDAKSIIIISDNIIDNTGDQAVYIDGGLADSRLTEVFIHNNIFKNIHSISAAYTPWFNYSATAYIPIIQINSVDVTPSISHVFIDNNKFIQDVAYSYTAGGGAVGAYSVHAIDSLSFSSNYYSPNLDSEIYASSNITTIIADDISGLVTSETLATLNVTSELKVSVLTLAGANGLYEWADANDTAIVGINYKGYLGATSYFRDFGVYDGKSVSLLFVDGSAKRFGFNSTAPDKTMEINSASGANLRLTYNDANGSAVNYADLSTSSSGDLAIVPSGGNLAVTGDIDVPAANAFYFGAVDTDGTWRIVRSGNNLLMQRRELGSYVTKQTIAP